MFTESEEDKAILKCWWKPEAAGKTVTVKKHGFFTRFDMEDVPELIGKLLNFYMSTGGFSNQLPDFDKIIRASKRRYVQGLEKRSLNNPEVLPELETHVKDEAAILAACIQHFPGIHFQSGDFEPRYNIHIYNTSPTDWAFTVKQQGEWDNWEHVWTMEGIKKTSITHLAKQFQFWKTNREKLAAVFDLFATVVTHSKGSFIKPLVIMEEDQVDGPKKKRVE